MEGLDWYTAHVYLLCYVKPVYLLTDFAPLLSLMSWSTVVRRTELI